MWNGYVSELFTEEVNFFSLSSRVNVYVAFDVYKIGLNSTLLFLHSVAFAIRKTRWLKVKLLGEVMDFSDNFFLFSFLLVYFL